MGLAQALQTALHQVAGVSVQYSQVSDDPHCHQVKLALQHVLLTCVAEEILSQFIGYTHTRQCSEGMTFGEQLRVDHSIRLRQGRRQVVVVGNDHIHARLLGKGNRFVGADACIASQQDLRLVSRIDDLLQHRQINPVRFAGAHRDMIGYLCTQAAQGRYQQSCGSLPVHVKIAPHADSLFALDGLLKTDGCLYKTGQLFGWGGGIYVGVQECPGSVRIQDTAMSKCPGNQGTTAHRGAQAIWGRDFGWFTPGAHGRYSKLSGWW